MAQCALAQAPLPLHQTRYRVRAGERVAIQAPADTVRLVREATRIRSRFAFAPEPGGESLLLGVPLLTEPGEYSVPVEITGAGGTAHSAMLQVTVEPHATVPSNSPAPPVILLDGWQAPSSTSACPIQPDSTGTFGNLSSYLTARPNQVPVVYFFENCTECPACALEKLGANLGAFLDSLRYDNGSPVPQVDVIAHSMGGLIVRSYLSGKQAASGTFTPPAVPKIRKAVFLATPHFGAYLADNPLAPLLFGSGVQPQAMKRGSQFLWDLATWNQLGDDLRGIDAVAVAGNGGLFATPPFPGDGVVGMSSASLAFTSPTAAGDGRTRVVNYCHVALDPGLEASVLGCTGSGIAHVDSPQHLSYQIIQSFLAGTSDWQSIGSGAGQDSTLSTAGGLFLAARNAKDQDLNDLTSAAFGVSALTAGPANPTTSVFFNDLLPPGAYNATAVSAAAGPLAAPLTLAAGGYRPLLLKQGPAITSVRSAVATGLAGVTVASGSNITITGSGFDASAVVIAGGVKLATSSIAPQQIVAFFPVTVSGLAAVSGLVNLTVTTTGGQAGTRILVAPASYTPPAIALSANSFFYTFAAGNTTPIVESVAVTNSGGGSLVWSAASDSPWLTVTTTANALTLTANPAGLATGTLHGSITVTAGGASNSPQTISVTVLLIPIVTVTSVTNAASGAAGPIAPGEIVTIKGSGFGPAAGISFTPNASGGLDPTLGGTRVFFGAFAAPLTYVSATQINAIVPHEVAGRTLVSLQVLPQPQGAQVLVPLPVSSTAPGFFTVNAAGTGQILATNQDGSLNGAGKPAPKGSYVTLYFTGGGETTPPGVTGSINGAVLKNLVQTATVTVGGQAATVTFAGAAPGLVDGVQQLNLRLADDARSGAAQPVVLTIGGASTPALATIAVQ